MASKHLDHIVEILKISGPLPAIALKQRVLARMSLQEDAYPKSTFQDHLVKLYDEQKIDFKTEDNKRIYFVHKYEHPVPGGLLLENANGRINVPPHLLSFNVQITKDINREIIKNNYFFIIEFHNERFCLSINKSAVPFNIHISRKKFERPIFENITNNFGKRTITLELPVFSLSSYKDGLSGHAIVSFNEKEFSLTDLGTRNGSFVLNNKSLTLNSFLEMPGIGRTDETIDSEYIKKNEVGSMDKLETGKEHKLAVPQIIMLANEFRLAIF